MLTVALSWVELLWVLTIATHKMDIDRTYTDILAKDNFVNVKSQGEKNSP